MRPSSITVFAGPSAYGLDPGLRSAELDWRAPAQRDDIGRLVDTLPPGVIVLCDGIFQSVPSVSHEELCRALDGGWQVWGVASMGAIRAWELRGEGMRGFGSVYAMFERLPDLCDDEMCLMHFPEEPYFPLTEALVNVRYALDRFGPECSIDPSAAARLIERLRGMWFGERSLTCIRRILVDELGVGQANADAWLARMQDHRIKTLDLADLLRTRPWQTPAKE